MEHPSSTVLVIHKFAKYFLNTLSTRWKQGPIWLTTWTRNELAVAHSLAAVCKPSHFQIFSFIGRLIDAWVYHLNLRSKINIHKGEILQLPFQSYSLMFSSSTTVLCKTWAYIYFFSFHFISFFLLLKVFSGQLNLYLIMACVSILFLTNNGN